MRTPARIERLSARIAEMLRSALALERAHFDADAPLSYLGVDSLMAVDLRREIATAFRVNLPVLELVRGPSIAELAAAIERLLETSIAPEAAIGQSQPDRS
jgi:acyl carrier protein